MGVHLVTNKVILSQPVPDLKSKKFFYKSFSIRSIEYKNAFRKMNWEFILSQIKSFCHNLLLTSYQKSYFIKVSIIDQFNTEMISENLNECSFVTN